MNRFDVDMFSLVETQLNPYMFSPDFRLSQLLSTRHSPSIITLANNNTEGLGTRQQGGVCTAICGRFTSSYATGGADPTGLGRWNWIEIKTWKYQGSSNHCLPMYQK